MKKKFDHPCFYERGLEAAQALMCLICAIWESRWDCSIQSLRSEVLSCRPLSTALVPLRLHLLRLPVKFQCSAAARSTRSVPLWRRMPDRTSVRRRWIVSTRRYYWQRSIIGMRVCGASFVIMSLCFRGSRQISLLLSEMAVPRRSSSDAGRVRCC